MKKHLTIDPGKKTGWAIWRGREAPEELVAEGEVRGEAEEQAKELIERAKREGVGTAWIEKPVPLPTRGGAGSWASGALTDVSIRAGWIGGRLRGEGIEVRWIDSRWAGTFRKLHPEEARPHPSKHVSDAINLGRWIRRQRDAKESDRKASETRSSEVPERARTDTPQEDERRASKEART